MGAHGLVPSLKLTIPGRRARQQGEAAFRLFITWGRGHATAEATPLVLSREPYTAYYRRETGETTTLRRCVRFQCVGSRDRVTLSGPSCA